MKIERSDTKPANMNATSLVAVSGVVIMSNKYNDPEDKQINEVEIAP